MRAKLPPAVNLRSTFEDLFGKNSAAFSSHERMERWERWKALARRKDPWAVTYWQDDSACQGCIHLRGGWCELMGLPATVNPILSFRLGVIGMACMGCGKTYSHPPLPLGEPPCL